MNWVIIGPSKGLSLVWDQAFAQAIVKALSILALGMNCSKIWVKMQELLHLKTNTISPIQANAFQNVVWKFAAI